jgi:hypothetical protein
MTKYFTGTLKEYSPLGRIEQLPELKSEYRGKSSAGGRRAIFKSAGVGPLSARWMRGVEIRGPGTSYEIRVKLQITPGQLTLIPW